MTETKPILPGTTLGLMGGGQLGRMFAQAAAAMGYRVAVLEPQHDAPAAEVSAEHIEAPYNDADGLDRLAERCPCATTEFENVPADSLRRLAAKGTLTAPPAHAVAVTQDRNVEKHFVESVAGVPVAPHCAVLSEKDVALVDEALFPGILKTARLGYDGKGQYRVKNRDELLQAFRNTNGVECVFEKMLPLKLELSVIVCRSLSGETKTFPAAENHHRNGILAMSVLPARVPEAVAEEARAHAMRIADALEYVGVLCVEFFLLEDDTLLVNELAPRPHNSGHATIDACVTSQYEEQVRAMTGMPLGDTTRHSCAVMLNVLGDEWFDAEGRFRDPDWRAVLAVPGAKLHLYGKKEARRARKMGHVTCVAPTLDEAFERARTVARILGLPDPE